MRAIILLFGLILYQGQAQATVSAEQVIALLEKYQVAEIYDHDEAIELYEGNPQRFIFELLYMYGDDDQILWYSIANDHWSPGIVNDFYSNVESLIEMSPQPIEISNVQLQLATASAGKDESDVPMLISFHHQGKTQNWRFTRNNPKPFVKGFSQWAYQALDGNFFFLDQDYPIGFLFPKAFITELENYGIHSDLDKY